MNTDVRNYFLSHEKDSVRHVFTAYGFNFGGRAQNAGFAAILLKSWDARTKASQSAQAIAARAYQHFASYEGAQIVPFLPADGAPLAEPSWLCQARIAVRRRASAARVDYPIVARLIGARARQRAAVAGCHTAVPSCFVAPERSQQSPREDIPAYYHARDGAGGLRCCRAPLHAMPFKKVCAPEDLCRGAEYLVDEVNGQRLQNQRRRSRLSRMSERHLPSFIA